MAIPALAATPLAMQVGGGILSALSSRPTDRDRRLAGGGLDELIERQRRELARHNAQQILAQSQSQAASAQSAGVNPALARRNASQAAAVGTARANAPVNQAALQGQIQSQAQARDRVQRGQFASMQGGAQLLNTLGTGLVTQMLGQPSAPAGILSSGGPQPASQAQPLGNQPAQPQQPGQARPPIDWSPQAGSPVPQIAQQGLVPQGLGPAGGSPMAPLASMIPGQMNAVPSPADPHQQAMEALRAQMAQAEAAGDVALANRLANQLAQMQLGM